MVRARRALRLLKTRIGTARSTHGWLTIPLVPAARVDLLARAGLVEEAAATLLEADLAPTGRERRALLRRATEIQEAP